MSIVRLNITLHQYRDKKKKCSSIYGTRKLRFENGGIPNQSARVQRTRAYRNLGHLYYFWEIKIPNKGEK